MDRDVVVRCADLECLARIRVKGILIRGAVTAEAADVEGPPRRRRRHYLCNPGPRRSWNPRALARRPLSRNWLAPGGRALDRLALDRLSLHRFPLGRLLL